jgi:hypothetical protein
MSDQITGTVVVDEQQQLTFVDQRDVASEEVQVFGHSAPITAFNRYAMPGSEMSSLDILKHPIRIAGFDWLQTDTPNAMLWTARAPELMANLNSFHRLMLETYAFFKPTLNLRFVMNSTKFHVGRLIVTLDPFHQMQNVSDESLIDKQWNRYAATGNPNVLLDASMSNVADILIPFEHIQDYLTTNSSETFDLMSVVRVNVLNQLRVATGTQGTVTVQVFLNCVDLDLHVPIHPHLAILPSRMMAQGGVVSSVKDIGTNAAGAVYNTMTGNFGKAATSAGKAFGGVGKVLGEFNLDKPADPLAAVMSFVQPFSPLSHGTGVDPSVRLGNAPLGNYLEHGSFSGATTEGMDLWKICNLKMLTNTIPWPSAALDGTVLLKIPVMPTYCAYENAISAPYTKEFPTFLSYIAQMFTYWRGSIEIRVDAVSSFFHTGRLLIFFEPNVSTNPPTNLQQYTNNEGLIFDLKESKSICVSVPFQSSLPRKTVVPYTSISALAEFTDQHILGYVYIVVLNRLTAPSNVAGMIDLNVYVGGGEDMEFEVPILDPAVQFKVPQNPARQDAQGDEEDLPLRTADLPGQWLSKGSGNVSRMNVFNEGVRDVRELTRRFTLTGRFIVSLIETGFPGLFEGELRIPVSPLIYSKESNGPLNYYENFTTATSFHNRVARLYALYTGSMRAKIVPYLDRTQPVILTATYEPNAGIWKPLALPVADRTSIGPDSTGFPTHMTNTSQSVALQVEMPYFSGYNQLLVETVEPATSFPPDTAKAGELVIRVRTFNTTGLPVLDDIPFVPIDLFTATGDDIFFSYLVAPPVTYSARNIVDPPTPVP